MRLDAVKNSVQISYFLPSTKQKLLVCKLFLLNELKFDAEHDQINSLIIFWWTSIHFKDKIIQGLYDNV